MKNFKTMFLLVFLMASLAILPGCNLFGDDDDDDVAVTPAAVSGPAASADFSGVTLSVNPTIVFAADLSFTYKNNADDSSAFPSANGTTLTGTYAYVPAADKKTGDLTLTFTDNSTLVFSLAGFMGYSTGITSCKATVGQTAYDVTVSGSLVPVAAATAATGGTDNGTATTIPDTFAQKGKTIMLKFFQNDRIALPDSITYQNDAMESFTFGTDNTLTIGTGNTARSLGTPKIYKGSTEIVWYDATNNYYYALSFTDNNEVSDLNIYGLMTHPYNFYGQFYDPANPDKQNHQ